MFYRSQSSFFRLSAISSHRPILSESVTLLSSPVLPIEAPFSILSCPYPLTPELNFNLSSSPFHVRVYLYFLRQTSPRIDIRLLDTTSHLLPCPYSLTPELNLNLPSSPFSLSDKRLPLPLTSIISKLYTSTKRPLLIFFPNYRLPSWPPKSVPTRSNRAIPSKGPAYSRARKSRGGRQSRGRDMEAESEL
jgi:hypothetical protein